MQLLPESIPQDWTSRILTLLIGALGGGTVYKVLTLIANKGQRKADVAVRNAEAANIKLDALAKAEDLMVRLQNRLDHLEATSDERERRCQEQVRFLEKSVTYQRQMLSAYIRRGHEFAAEVGKLVLFIKNRDIDLATATEKAKRLQNLNGLPEGAASELTELVMLIVPTDLRFRSGEEITRAIPLPKPPDGVESLSDSGEFKRLGQ